MIAALLPVPPLAGSARSIRSTRETPSFFKWYAVLAPVMPAPTTITSNNSVIVALGSPLPGFRFSSSGLQRLDPVVLHHKGLREFSGSLVLRDQLRPSFGRISVPAGPRRLHQHHG